jgi:hypothetical protein
MVAEPEDVGAFAGVDAGTRRLLNGHENLRGMYYKRASIFKFQYARRPEVPHVAKRREVRAQLRMIFICTY